MKGIKNLTTALVMLVAAASINTAAAQQLLNEYPVLIPPPIEKEWQNRLDNLKKGERDKASAAIEQIKKIEIELGIENIDLISMALLAEADENISRGELAAALEDAYAAKEISPGHPSSYYLISKIILMKDRSILEALSSYIDGLIASYKDFWSIFYWSGTLLIILFLSLISSFIIFLLYLLVRHASLLEHNISEWTGVRFKRYTIIMIIIIISSLPLLLQRGIIWVPIFWLMLVWIYLRKREMIIGVLFLILLGAAALLFSTAESYFVSGGSKGLDLMNRIFRGEWISPLNPYELVINEDRDDWKGYFSAAISMKMQGRFDEALQYYEQALAKKVVSAKILNNIGNIYYYKKDHEKAIGFYKAAIEKDSRLVSPRYNISQALREMLSFEEGNKKYEEARGLNRELTDLYAKKSTLSYQHLVIDENFSVTDLFEKAISYKGVKRDGVISHISTFINGLPAPFFQISLIALIFLMSFSSSYLNKKAYLAIQCPVCGKAICRRCHRYVFDSKVCNNCLGLIKKRQEEKKNIKNLSDIKETLVRSKRKEKRANILAILMPGIGHLYMDRAIKGYIINLLFFILIWSWLIDSTFTKTLLSQSAILEPYRNLCYALLIIAIIGYSVFDIYRSREHT